ncbi:MAG: oligopeptide transporter, OPT family [Planctomycetota bacterium]|nr:MAG: oligopeptide transporter, OPT family [Planctomycetota bacterium]
MGHAAPPPPPAQPAGEHKPYVPDDANVAEFTPKAILFGALFGILFGAATVYLALRAGLTVSASIPIAVLSISVLRVFGRPTILENNIVQTIGSAGESVAAGVAFTIPAMLFLSPGANGEQYFQYMQIMTLACVGGILGVLFMVPLRRSLIVGEHGTLPYPEGTACAEVLVAGEKGGNMAKLVFQGVGLAVVYNVLMKVFALWKESPIYVSPKTSTLPNATVSAEPTAEYLGVGYILGPRVGGIMASGAILSWIVLIPLLSLLIPEATRHDALKSLGRSDGWIAGASGPRQVYEAYVRYIGAGAVTMAGIITLIRTAPTIWRAITQSASSMGKGAGGGIVKRTERDIPMWVVAVGSLGLVGVLTALPILPGDFTGKLVMAVLMIVFGFLFVTVSSRIVGIIGSSSNPISGMTIATLLGTALVFLSMGLKGDINQPIALSVGAIVCIAAANAGATSQDLKTGYLVGATPIRQQFGLVIGVIASVLAIGWTMKMLDSGMAPEGMAHGIGTDKLPAPQATLMATVIKGVLSQSLPWGYIMVGAGLAVAVYLCGVSPLAWAVGAYLPFATSFTIFLGGLLRGFVDKKSKASTESEISPGMLFATGLVAGGSLTGVVVGALNGVDMDMTKPDGTPGTQSVIAYLSHYGESLQKSMAEAFGANSPDAFAMIMFGLMAFVLYRVAMKPSAAK